MSYSELGDYIYGKKHVKTIDENNIDQVICDIYNIEPIYKKLPGQDGRKFFTPEEYDQIFKQQLSKGAFKEQLLSGTLKGINRSIQADSVLLSNRRNCYNIVLKRILLGGRLQQETFNISYEMGSIELDAYSMLMGKLPQNYNKANILLNKFSELNNITEIKANRIGLKINNQIYDFDSKQLNNLLDKALQENKSLTELIIEESKTLLEQTLEDDDVNDSDPEGM